MTALAAWTDLLARTYDVLRIPVSRIDDAVLDERTPCSEWRVRELFEHAVGAIDMFATGAGAAPRDRPATGGPVERLDAAASRSEATWRAVTDPAAAVILPFGEFPAAEAVGMNQFDSLVHAWDLAMALGLPSPLPDDLTQVALLTSQVRFRTRPRSTWFAPELPARDDSAQERLLALTGRDTAPWAARAAGVER